MKHISVFLFTMLLASCGESTDDAYNRGYEEGIEEVCYEVKRISENFHDRLRSDRICY